MKRTPSALNFALAASLVFATACATSRPRLSDDGQQHRQTQVGTSQRSASGEGPSQEPEAPAAVGRRVQEPAGGLPWVESPSVRISTLPDGRWALSFPDLTLSPDLERLSVEEVRPLLAAVDSLRPRRARPRLRLLEVPGATHSNRGPAIPWESRLREDFLSLFGPALLPTPESLESSKLVLALQLSTRYMDDGIRDAAQELFSAPAFVLGVSLSIAVYFAAWLAPEPLFSKAFAAALTVRLSLLVGVVELARLAVACIQLHQEAEAATTPQELEAASERFGKSVGGTALRVLVVVASLGVPQVLPQVPKGGIWTLLSPLRHAPAGGPALESVNTAHVVADGTLLITGVAAGTSATSLCGEFSICMMMGGADGTSESGPKLSTRYGKPRTRQNPPHNEAIEQELARREAAGHTGLRKNEAQVNAQNMRVDDPNPLARHRFRKPDVSSRRPDGLRHNTNYVSNPRDLQRELDAFSSMVRADPMAIQELFLLDGTLVRRYVPPGIGFP